MGMFTMIWGRPPKTQPSTTLISPIGKPPSKADPKDWGATYSFCMIKIEPANHAVKISPNAN